MAIKEHGLEALRKAAVHIDSALTEASIRTFDVSGMLSGISYDAIDIQQTSSTVETYVFKTGGLSGTTVKTIVITYTDSTKADLNTVEAT